MSKHNKKIDTMLKNVLLTLVLVPVFLSLFTVLGVILMGVFGVVLPAWYEFLITDIWKYLGYSVLAIMGVFAIFAIIISMNVASANAKVNKELGISDMKAGELIKRSSKGFKAFGLSLAMMVLVMVIKSIIGFVMNHF